MEGPRTFIFLAFIIFGIFGVSGVKISRFYVPRGATHFAPLECKYDLESEKLYDVKWYKDGQQFFRCLPSGEIMEYQVEGVKVTHTGYASLGSCSLTVTMLTKKSAGEYKCEVSTESPEFKIAVASSKLSIIEFSRRTQNKTETKAEEEAVQNGAARFQLSSSVFAIFISIYIKNIIY